MDTHRAKGYDIETEGVPVSLSCTRCGSHARGCNTSSNTMGWLRVCNRLKRVHSISWTTLASTPAPMCFKTTPRHCPLSSNLTHNRSNAKATNRSSFEIRSHVSIQSTAHACVRNKWLLPTPSIINACRDECNNCARKLAIFCFFCRALRVM